MHDFNRQKSLSVGVAYMFDASHEAAAEHPPQQDKGGTP